jgi:hypothetical protein
MPDAEDAMEFLSKLDMARYGEMFSFLTNRAHLDEDFPAMLHDAWQVVSKWTVSNPHGGKMDSSGELLSACTLADERAPSLIPKQPISHTYRNRSRIPPTFHPVSPSTY